MPCGESNAGTMLQPRPVPSLLVLPRGSKYPIVRYLEFWVIVILVQVLGKYMIIRYLDP